MVGRRRKQKLLGNHQSSWVWGQNVVQELLKSDHWLPVEILVADDLDPEVTGPIGESARDLGISFELTTRDRITQLCKATDHQGMLAKMPAFPYLAVEELVDGLTSDPLLILLDGIQDPFNFGAICRSAVVFGVDGIILGERNQVGVTSQVVRSAAGAINQLNIAKSSDLLGTVQQLNSNSVQTLATSLTADTELPYAKLCGALAIVIGNEGEGVRQSIAAECQSQVRIPQPGNFDSLNAAVATGVVLYEVTRQKSF
jgi:23S rRNA (guanosine2251-2'-O)-methyltransferase